MFYELWKHSHLQSLCILQDSKCVNYGSTLASFFCAPSALCRARSEKKKALCCAATCRQLQTAADSAVAWVGPGGLQRTEVNEKRVCCSCSLLLHVLIPSARCNARTATLHNVRIPSACCSTHARTHAASAHARAHARTHAAARNYCNARTLQHAAACSCLQAVCLCVCVSMFVFVCVYLCLRMGVCECECM